MFSASVDIRKAVAKLNKAERDQVPFAMSLALNETAWDVVEDLKIEMAQVFDRPTRWTLNSMRVQRATKRKLSAVVLRKTPQRGRHYLEVQSKGGPRKQTGFERVLGSRLKYAGIVRTVTPASGARLNVSGNISPALRNRVMSSVKAQRDATSNTTRASRSRNKRRAEYFVPRANSKLSAGVWERSSNGKRIKKVLHFSDAVPNYKRRLDLRKVGQRTADRKFGPNFHKALNRALASAK